MLRLVRTLGSAPCFESTTSGCPLLCLLLVTGCGGAPRANENHASQPVATSAHVPAHPPAPARLVYQPLFSLPAPVQDPASAAIGGNRFVLLGGLTAADVSTADVIESSLRAPLRSSQLPGAQHDAQAATLGGRAYVFGGGQFQQYDHILGYDPLRGAVSPAGSLPRPASDVTAAAVGDTAYVVGGFDGTNWLDTIVAWRPGRPASVVGHLPVGLRYAAAASAGGELVIAGGTTPTGVSDAVLRFDPKTGRVTRLARLPHPITHASAAALGGRVYVIGGRGAAVTPQFADVLAIDPQ